MDVCRKYGNIATIVRQEFQTLSRFNNMDVVEVLPTSIFVNRKRFLGTGAFGEAFYACCKNTYRQVVVKEINENRIFVTKEVLVRELRNLTILSRKPHKNIIQFYGYFAVENIHSFVLQQGDINLSSFILENKTHIFKWGNLTILWHKYSQ